MVGRRSETLFFLFLFAGILLMQTSAETCLMSGPCTCNFRLWKIDLSPLVASMKDSEPTFTDLSDGYIFNFNPCKPFRSNATDCMNQTDLAVNRIDNNGKCLVIGNQKNVAFSGDTAADGGIYLEYTNEISKSVAKIYLECSNEKSFKYMNQDPANPLTYLFKLKTVYACQPVDHRLSTGSILLILFTIAVTVYLIGGFIFKHFYLQAQGVEIIPHYSFWSDFPLLVRDGCYYTFRGCQGPATYERI